MANFYPFIMQDPNQPVQDAPQTPSFMDKFNSFFSDGGGLLGNDPQAYARNQGLLGMAAQLLQASGPSTTPTSLGQALGRGLQGYQQGQQNALKNSLTLRASIAKMGGYENVTQDDTGKWWGVNKTTNKVEQIPMTSQDQFTKFKTVQGTGATGLPETQLVNPGAVNAPGGRISIGGAPPAGYKYQDGKLVPIPGGPADQLTTEQKNQLQDIAQTSATADRLIKNFNPDYVGIRGGVGEFNDQFTSQVPGLSGVADAGRVQFRQDAATLVNNYIKAVTGATVGQSGEQQRLMRAVPATGDSPAVYLAKLKQMQQNLRELPSIIQRAKSMARGGSGAPSNNNDPLGLRK